jgi:hypothetical protein
MVILPTFLAQIQIQVRNRWFDLANRGRTEPPIEKAYQLNDRLSQFVRSSEGLSGDSILEFIQNAQYSRMASGRPGPASPDSLSAYISHFRALLPFQTLTVRVPHENTIGGFEVFNSSAAGLAPELYGFYGTPSLSSYHSTSLYLVGNNFSVRGTRVIAGGISITNFTLMSRQLMEVAIPDGVFLEQGVPTTNLEVHVATPYGVTRRQAGLLLDRFHPSGRAGM